MLKMIPWLFIATVVVVAGCEGTQRGDGNEGDGGLDGGTDDTDSATGGNEDITCEPGEIWCYRGWVAKCNAEGKGWKKSKDCGQEGLVCAAGKCDDVSRECADAINEHSYIGCDYWGTTLANIELNWDTENNVYNDGPFHYAIAVANNSNDEAEVTVTDGADINNNYTVPGGETITIEDLPWKMTIKNPGDCSTNTWATRKVANAAYHLTSTRPVTAYQFNPLHYQSGSKFSFTNDASLLLPSHVYRDEYMVMTRGTLKLQTSLFSSMSRPGFVAIVGVEGGTTQLGVTSSAHTAASDIYSNATYPALAPGLTANIDIEPYEVLQILSDAEPGCTDTAACNSGTTSYQCCNAPPEYDLTGTMIKVMSGPNPAVFAGTVMSFVPYNVWAA
ncbi:MAG: hypothetical protein PHU25_08205, partial [Deltaproteobacteria bacterium]|nr:hypothetical protein [Deltaproteobacteria bacterium]